MRVFIFILFYTLCFACGNDREYYTADSTGSNYRAEEALELDGDIDLEPPRSGNPKPEEFSLDKGSKIIKNGNLKFEVNKLEQSKTRIDSLLSSLDGYYENEQYNSATYRNSYSLNIRIPSANFDTFVAQLENGVGDLKSKNISTEDVTEQYVDLNIRLENNLAYLKQYQQVLQKAKSIKEILEVKEKIRKIEEEIESKSGRIKYLDDKVKYSTLNLEISELITSEVSNSPNFGRRILNAFNGGVESFLTFIVALVNLWPFVLLLMALLFFRRPILNLFGRRKK